MSVWAARMARRSPTESMSMVMAPSGYLYHWVKQTGPTGNSISLETNMVITSFSVPVRAAETINRLAGRSPDESFDPPRAVMITRGAEAIETTAHACRLTPRGRQILVCIEGHLTWIAAQRVQVPADRGSKPPDPTDRPGII